MQDIPRTIDQGMKRKGLPIEEVQEGAEGGVA